MQLGLLRVHETVRVDRMQLHTRCRKTQYQHDATAEETNAAMSYTSQWHARLPFQRMAQNVGRSGG